MSLVDHKCDPPKSLRRDTHDIWVCPVCHRMYQSIRPARRRDPRNEGGR